MGTAPKPEELRELAALTAIAHPRRQAILEHLSMHGPATSADLARALDLNTGATSYHLRELAQHGFVAEIPERAHGRQRWWRAVRRDIRFPRRSEQTGPTRMVADELNRNTLAADLDLFARAHDNSAQLGEWEDALLYSRSALRLTMAELREFFEEYIELCNRYRRPDGADPPGTRTVATRWFAIPIPDPPDEDDDETSADPSASEPER